MVTYMVMYFKRIYIYTCIYIDQMFKTIPFSLKKYILLNFGCGSEMIEINVKLRTVIRTVIFYTYSAPRLI